jgi:hypothetical protein
MALVSPDSPGAGGKVVDAEKLLFVRHVVVDEVRAPDDDGFCL